VDFDHRPPQRESCEWHNGKIYCTIFQLVVTIEPIEIFVQMQSIANILPNTFWQLQFDNQSKDDKQCWDAIGCPEPRNVFPEVASENWITVEDNRLGHSMEFEDIFMLIAWKNLAKNRGSSPDQSPN